MKNRIDDCILDTSDILKEAGTALLNNGGKLAALAAVIIAAALTFTDVSFSGISPKDTLPSLLLLLVSSYVIYFSLEDAGERLGQSTEEYIRARKRYDALREKIVGDDLEALRRFCHGYSERELEARRASLMLYLGISREELAAKEPSRALKRARRRLERMKPIFITPRALLCSDKCGNKSELENPGKRKPLSLLLRLIPSTVCMAITVSVMLTAKDGLDAAEVLNGVLKLSALPVVGFKGYSQGYSYVKHKESGWIETKCGMLESFLSSKSAPVCLT